MTSVITSLDGTSLALAREQFAEFPDASPAGDPRWLEPLLKCYKTQAVIIPSDDGSYLFTGYLRRNFKGHKHLYGLRNGALAKDEAAAERLQAALADYAKQQGLRRCLVCTGATPLPATTLEAGQKTTLFFEVEEDAETQLKKLSTSGRWSVRRAWKNGVTLAENDRLIEVSHSLYAGRMQEKGVATVSLPFMEAAAAAFGDDINFLVAEFEGDYVATAVIVHGQKTSQYNIAGSTPEGQKLQAGQMLVYEMLNRARENGSARLDLGESTPGSGVYTFKYRMGATPTPVYYYDPIEGAPKGNFHETTSGSQGSGVKIEQDAEPKGMVDKLKAKAARVGRRII